MVCYPGDHAKFSLITGWCFPKVDIKIADISSFGFSEHPHLYPPLSRFLWHVLPEEHSALIFDHRLVNTHFLSMPIKMFTPTNALISSGVVGYHFLFGLDTCFSCAYRFVSSARRSKNRGSQRSSKKSSGEASAPNWWTGPGTLVKART